MKPLTLGVIDIDHRHIYGQLANLQALGCTCKGWYTEGSPEPLDGFVKRFPDLPRVEDRRALLDDPEIDLILMAGIPAVRAGRALEAMRAGKDVMTDKPGCTTLEQLADLRACVAETGRIWSIDFSERFEVPAVSRAAELVQAGAIGRVVQTVGLGPHRLNRPTRPGWFFEEEKYGGILVDIASHQIDQYLFIEYITTVGIEKNKTGKQVILVHGHGVAGAESGFGQDLSMFLLAAYKHIHVVNHPRLSFFHYFH